MSRIRSRLRSIRPAQLSQRVYAALTLIRLEKPSTERVKPVTRYAKWCQ
jgi:hypothetical protein